MTRYFGTIFLFLAFLTGSTDEHDDIRDTSLSVCEIEERAFTEGETLRYKLYYNWGVIWLSAGEVVFRVSEEKDQIKLISQGHTYSSYDWLFSVRNRYESILDPNTLLPMKSIRDIQEGNYQLYDEVYYDREEGVAISHRAKSKEEEKNRKEYEISSCAHDLVSILYSARSIPFSIDKHKEGTRIPIPLFLDKDEYDLELIYKRQRKNERIKGVGTFDLLEFSPKLIDGDYFKEGDEMKIWVTNDDNKLPVYIESPLSVGKVKAIIMDYHGLKYPLEAKRK